MSPTFSEYEVAHGKRMSTNSITIPRLDRNAIAVIPLFDFDNGDERAYWHSQTPEARLQHMELLRRINYGDKATTRLQRVLELAPNPCR